MSSFNEPVVVVGFDGTPAARAAAEWAAAEADRRGVALRAVTAYVSPAEFYPALGLLSSELVQAARAWARQLLYDTAHQLGELYPGLRVQTAMHYGHPVKVLRKESRRAVLTVVGSHGSGQLSEALLGSVARRIAGCAESPVVVVRTHPSIPAPLTVGPVVVGVDGSPHAQAAIGFAFDEAAMRGAELVAIHTWDDGPLLRAFAAMPLAISEAELDADEHRLLAEQLAGWVEKYPDVKVRHLVRTGHPAATLLGHTDPDTGQPTQLLVVGSRGLGGFAGLLLGSTTAALIAHATCPVAVVRDQMSAQMPA